MKMEIWPILIVVLGVLVASCRDDPEPPAAPAEPDKSSLTIVAVGDSLTAGYGIEEGEAYPALVEKALRAEGMKVQVVNAGVSGETSSGTLARLDWVLTLDPDIVILETGANDGLRGLDTTMVRDNLEQIIDLLQQRDIVVILAGMKMVWNLGPAYTGEFNRIFPDLAAKKGLIFMPFFLQGVATDPALNRDDGIHPNPAGHRIIADNILPFVREAITVLGSKASR
ncbi:MAG: arylesterase [Desulfoprunum sp.]|jgi:acyl-CoA thioesterase-1|uniref:arylesterase n=1 Tax=Desulfoprunum sp. TaxID=2020866 RepID=UPI003C740551